MTGFDAYQTARADLSQRCAELERIWRDASHRTALEQLAGGPSHDDSLVGRFISEIRMRLASSVVEVGVFGSIKRGKSTLLNALIGAEVSPMRVTPETAVPVWIENGPAESRVLLLDGTVVEDLSMEQAQLMSTQRYRSKDAEKKPLRVEHRMRIPWLPTGVRIVDTPGLDDPSLAEDYEKLTIAELERVAATIFVMVSPPGPSGEELRLLRTLGSRAVDKLFLVCNFYPDHWKDAETVAEMTRYIEQIVVEGAGEGVDSRDVRVFAVSAKDGLLAALSGDQEALEASGVAALRRDLENYLSRGALDRMLGYVDRRVRMVVDLTKDLLVERRRILVSPDAAQTTRDSHRREIAASKLLMAELIAAVDKVARELEPELLSIVMAPIATARDAVAKAERSADLETASNRLRIQFETAASEASRRFNDRAGLEQIRLQRNLYESFGIDERIRLGTGRLELGGIGDVAPALPRIAVDKDSIIATGVASAAVGGLSAATIAGGAGVALLAMGPVGWLIGLGVGALVAGGLGATAARLVTKDAVKAEHRQDYSQRLADVEMRVKTAVASTMTHWRHDAERELEGMRSSYFSERESELGRIEAIIADEASRKAEIAKIDVLLDRLGAVVV